MRSVDRFHSPAPEELMEYVDGEGSAAGRAAIEAHLATCATCQALVADQRTLTGRMQAWRVPPAPAALPPKEARRVRAWWQPSRTLAAGLATAAAVLVIGVWNQSFRSGRPPAVAAKVQERVLSEPASPSAAPAAPVEAQSRRSLAAGNVQQDRSSGGGATLDRIAPSGPRTPSVIRTARLQIVANDFTTARASVESIVTAANGFIDQLTVSGDTSRARVVQGTLRVPADRLSAVMTQLRALGQVVEDTQGSQDVTDQIVDLDARLATARATEQRLTELLRNRTGRLSDVLEVERELTRVRLDIERLDAEKTNVTRRVSYATVDLRISEERKETIAGPLSLTTRLKVAALDGMESAFDSMAAVVLLALRAGPTLLFWSIVAGSIWLAIRRMRDSRSAIQDPR